MENSTAKAVAKPDWSKSGLLVEEDVPETTEFHPLDFSDQGVQAEFGATSSSRLSVPPPGQMEFGRKQPPSLFEVAQVPGTSERAEAVIGEQRSREAAMWGEPIQIGEGQIELPRFGEEGTILRGASDVVAGFGEWALNKPEEILALTYPATAAAIAARYTPEVAKQFVVDVVEGYKGNKEAQGRAIALAALVISPAASKTAVKGIKGAKLVDAQAAAEASFVDFLARERLSIRDQPALVAGHPIEPSLAESAKQAGLFESAKLVESLEKPKVIGETPTPSQQAGISTSETAPAGEAPGPVSKKVEFTPEESAVSQPEIIGMGGVVPSEFKPASATPTGIKNAQVDIERQKRGLPPAIEPAHRSFGAVWDEAMARIDRDPESVDRLVIELKAQSRALTDAEDAMLLHRQIDLQNEYGKATRDLAQAFDDKRELDVVEQKRRVDDLSDKLLELYNVNKSAGTETGRGLAARKMMANEDFTLASLTVQKRAAVGGRRLTESETAEVARVYEEYQVKIKELEERTAKAEKEKSEAQAQWALAEIKAQAAKEQQVPSQIKRIVEKVGAVLDRRADLARERLRGKLFSLSPDVLADLAEIGASNIYHVGIDLAKWSAKMVEEIGERVRPHLQKIWDESLKLIDSTAETMAGAGTNQAEKVKRTAKKQDPVERQQDLAAQIKTKAESGDLGGLSILAQKLARAFVEINPKIMRDELVDSVHDVLKQALPEINRRETMDAISGYGEFKQLSKDEISKQLRDLKGQLQQVAKLEDMAAGQAPQKTGIERRAPSDEERRLIKLVNEAKKKGGFVVTDLATQLASALSERKTYYRNRISDLEQEIRTRERIVREKAEQPSDPDLIRLKEEYNRLRVEHEEIFGKRELTDEQRLKMATAAAEKQLEEWQERLVNAQQGKFGKLKPTGKKVVSSELDAIRARTESIREEVKHLNDLANPKKSPEERALQAWKTRSKNRIAELEERLARGDFSRRAKAEMKFDTEGTRIRFQLEEIKRRWMEGLLQDKLSQRNLIQKGMGTVHETLNTMRAILTSADLSAVLRQGGIISFSHPVRAASSIVPMLKAFKSPEAAFRIMEEINARPNAQLYRQSKLYIADEASTLSKMEEAYMSRWAKKIPIVAASERAYVTFLNKLRADSFDAMAKSLSRDGKVTLEEAQIISNYINVATGRAGLGKMELAAVGLNTLFFAPRYVASRFQFLTAQPLRISRIPYAGTGKARALVVKEYARFLAGAAVVYALGNMAGADIEIDPRSSDFGKLRFGNTRLDPMAGLIQATVLIGRVISGQTMTSAGKVRALRGPERKFGSATVPDVLARFLRTKLSPAIGTAVDIAAKESVVGEEATPATVAKRMLMPISFQDIYSTMLEQGVPAGAAMAVLSIFGIGLQTYDEK